MWTSSFHIYGNHYTDDPHIRTPGHRYDTHIIILWLWAAFVVDLVFRPQPSTHQTAGLSRSLSFFRRETSLTPDTFFLSAVIFVFFIPPPPPYYSKILHFSFFSHP